MEGIDGTAGIDGMEGIVGTRRHRRHDGRTASRAATAGPAVAAGSRERPLVRDRRRPSRQRRGARSRPRRLRSRRPRVRRHPVVAARRRRRTAHRSTEPRRKSCPARPPVRCRAPSRCRWRGCRRPSGRWRARIPARVRGRRSAGGVRCPTTRPSRNPAVDASRRPARWAPTSATAPTRARSPTAARRGRRRSAAARWARAGHRAAERCVRALRPRPGRSAPRRSGSTARSGARRRPIGRPRGAAVRPRRARTRRTGRPPGPWQAAAPPGRLPPAGTGRQSAAAEPEPAGAPTRGSPVGAGSAPGRPAAGIRAGPRAATAPGADQWPCVGSAQVVGRRAARPDRAGEARHRTPPRERVVPYRTAG